MSRSRVVLVGVVGSLLGLAACVTPPPTGTPIPSYYLPCVTSPVCPLVPPAYLSLNPVALSDNGDVMASINRPVLGTQALPESVELVSIHDRWFRRVLTGTTVASVAMSADGQKLAIVATGVQPTSTDPGGDGLFFFDHATGQVTRPDQPAGLYSTPSDFCCEVSMSADGSVVAATSGGAGAVFDTTADTYQLLTPPDNQFYTYLFSVSADGTTIVMSVAPDAGDDLSIYRYDVATGTMTTIGNGRAATVSGDGSRVLFESSPRFDRPLQTQIWDSTTDLSRILSTAEIDNLQLSTDGTRFFGTLLGSGLGVPIDELIGTVIDGGLAIDASGNATASYPAIAGPGLGDYFMVASRNGDHVIYRDNALLGLVRWNRN
jgi:hypothetical protein